MDFNVWLAYIAAGVTLGIAIMALYRDHRSFVHQVFSLGMIVFALDTGLTGFVYQASSVDDFLYWQRLRFGVASVVPAIWLLFSISFSRDNYREQVSKWHWLLLTALVLPVSIVIFFYDDFVSLILAPRDMSTLYIRVGVAGNIWHLMWVVLSVLILMNLERTFRHATGHMRWQTKFMFLGIGAVFGIHVLTDSQVLLYKGVDTDLTTVNLGALLVADAFILRSFFRGKPLNVGIHLSHQFLYNSFTALIVGIYFIAVGIISWFSLHVEWIKNVNLLIFLLFISVMGIAAFLLSDRLRLMRKRFISRHFTRPQYDYQKIWASFTDKTASVTQSHDLCNAIVTMVSETLEILSVSIWLVDEKQERLSFGGSTVFTKEQAENLRFFGQGGAGLIRAMDGQNMPIDLEGREDDWVADLKHSYGFEETKESRIRYCVPLNASGRLIGIMTLSEKVFYQPLTFEETELIKTIADQAAAGFLNLRLAESLRQAKELEAFQAMSAFFMHDLKNLASKLSLVTKNLPVHIDNPEFREDALRTISQSVSKINGMSSRLSLLSQKLDLNLKKTDLNDLVKKTISDMKDYMKVAVTHEFNEVPPLPLDGEQIHKVLENLLMNAYDALGPGGEITVVTNSNGNWAEIEVSDTGSGMSKEFMEKNLFRPFQTTKKQGMGIGLYHCKTIVEAHGGKIEAESLEGEGTKFRIILPVMTRNKNINKESK